MLIPRCMSLCKHLWLRRRMRPRQLLLLSRRLWLRLHMWVWRCQSRRCQWRTTMRRRLRRLRRLGLQWHLLLSMYLRLQQLLLLRRPRLR